MRIKSKIKYSLFITLTKVADYLNSKFDFSKLPYALELYNFIHKRMRIEMPEIVDTIHGFKMYLNPDDRTVSTSLALYGTYEQGITELFKKVVKKRDIVVDIGANIGYYTLLASKLVGENGKVYAFEPETENYRLLLKNIEINNAKNVIPLQKAVSNKRGTIKLYLHKHNPGAHSIVSKSKEFIEVESITLDEFFGMNSKVDVVKIDIEGGEMLALLGMSKIIKSNENIKMFIEFWPYGIRKSGYSPEEFVNELLKHDFKIFDIENKRLKTYEDLKSVKKATNLFITRNLERYERVLECSR
mgnify:CR=1 FL=1